MAKKTLPVKMVISWYVHWLVQALHEKYPHEERSGIARIEKKEWYYLLSDIRFPKQSNNASESEMSEWAVMELLEDIFDTAPEQLPERKCWIHSHHTMWCFWSHTDEIAKQGFDDGNIDYRWSIVTAYNAKGVDYKCALNVFKPIKAEFNVKVTTEEFDYDEYLANNMEHYHYYQSMKDTLLTEKESEENKIKLKYWTQIFSDESIAEMISIFNVEDNEENRKVCIDLLKKWSKSSMEFELESNEKYYDIKLEELQDECGIDIFGAKLKELEDNIEKPKYNYSFFQKETSQTTKPSIPNGLFSNYKCSIWSPTTRYL